MSMGDYSVAVKLTLINNVSTGLVAMAGQFAMLSRQSDIFQAKINALRFQGRVGAGLVAFGSAVASPFLGAINQAGKLEQQLLIIKSATQANTEAMDNYKKSIEQAATQTMFSSIEVAKMGSIIATTGNFKIGELASITNEFAKYATVQKLLKGTSSEASTKQGLQLAEITGHFDPKSIQNSLNLLTKLGLIMPDSITQVLNSMKYMQGTVKNVMGVEDEQGMLFIAMLNRMGISGTRAGSMLTAAISRSVPGIMGSGLWEGKSPQALQNMGLVTNGHANYYNQEGRFDAVKWMTLMGNFVKREFATKSPSDARQEIMKNFQFAFGANGSRIAGLMSSPEALKQFQQLQEVTKLYPDLDKLYSRMDGLYAKQLPEAMKNFDTLMVNIGYTVLPIATKALKFFNANMESLVKFMQNHEDTIRRFSEAFLWVAGLTTLGGVLLLVKVGLTGLMLPFQMMSRILPLLSAAFLPFNATALLVVAGIAAIGVAFYELNKHWDSLSESLSKNPVFKVLESAFYSLGYAMYHLIHPIETIKEILGWFSKFDSKTENPYAKEATKLNWLSGQAQAPISRGSPYIKGNQQTRVAVAPTEDSKKSDAKNQPIHVNLHVDGQKMASVVANHIYNQATYMPNTTSLYDTALSPMPTIVNSVGIT